MKRFYILLLLLLSCTLLAANPLARIYQEDDPILHDLETLSIEAGVLPLSSASPVTGHDLLRQIEVLQQYPLSSRSQALMSQLKNQIVSHLTNPQIGMQIAVSPEFYANTDDAAHEWDWFNRHNSRSPFLYGMAETVFADNIYGTMDYAIEKRLFEEDFAGASTNFPYMDNISETNLQNSHPHTAFMAISGPQSSLVFGRDTLGWGRGNTGNLTVGNHVPYHDFLQASARNSRLRYTFLAIPMNELDENGDAIIPYKPTVEENNWLTLFHGSLSRIYIAHRLEANFTPWLQVSLTEGTLFYTSRMDLRMFNPIMFIHNLQNFGEVNNTMTLEVEAALAPGWFLDAQFLLDQFQTAGEQSAYSDIPPNAYAGLLGVRFVKPTANGYLKGFVEGAYTSPYVYLRAGDSTQNYEGVAEEVQYNLDLVHAVNMRAGQGSVNFLGYQYGPDSIVAATRLAFEHANGFDVFADLRLLVQGERGLEAEDKQQELVTGISELNRPTPSGGNPTYTLITGIGGSMLIPETPIRIKSQAHFIQKWNDSGYRNDLQIVMGATYSLNIL